MTGIKVMFMDESFVRKISEDADMKTRVNGIFARIRNLHATFMLPDDGRDIRELFIELRDLFWPGGPERLLDPVRASDPTAISRWMAAKPGIGTFAVLYAGSASSWSGGAFPNNAIDCTGGITEKRVCEAEWILTNCGKDKTMEDDIKFCSDLHFYHKNIIRYCNRPWNSGTGPTGDIIVTDEDVERMNEDLIRNWNGSVGKDDTVYFLGDFCLGPDQQRHIPELVSRLNGKIHMIMGNHDHHPVKFYYDAGFYRVYDRPIVIRDFFILSHAPIQWVKDGGVWGNLYGHVHNQEMYRHYTANTFNCCVEVNGYRPVGLSEIMEKCGSVQEAG